MGYRQYETLIPQEDYLPFGLVATIIGFFLLAYFFMYLLHHLDIKSHTKLIKEHSKPK